MLKYKLKSKFKQMGKMVIQYTNHIMKVQCMKIMSHYLKVIYENKLKYYIIF